MKEVHMKKILFILLALTVILFLLPAPGVLAAPGGEYVIDEVDMTVTIPKDWTVFTRQTTKNDTDLKQLGLDQETVKEYLLDADGYIYALPDNNAFMFFTSYYEEYFDGIDNFTEYFFDLSSNEKQEMLNQIAQIDIDGLEMNNVQIYGSDDWSKYLFVQVDGYAGASQALMYMTILDSKSTGFAFYSLTDDPFTDAQKAEFQNIIDSVVFEGVKTYDEVLTENFLEQRRNKQITIAVIIGIIVVGIVVGISVSRGKKTKAKSVAQNAAISYENTAPTEEIMSTENVADESQAGSEQHKTTAQQDKTAADNDTQKLDKTVFCRKCGNRLPEDSEFCNQCGTKVRE